MHVPIPGNISDCTVTVSFYFIMNLILLQISHAAVSALCRSIKLQCELYSSRQIAICLDPYCGLGFVLWCLARCGKPSHPYRHPIYHVFFFSVVMCLIATPPFFNTCVLVYTRVTSLSWFLPSSWRAVFPCGWAHSVSTASGTPSAPTLSWNCALKDWEHRLSYSR